MVVFDAPVDIGRDEARDLAVRELADSVYADAEPSWWERASSWLWDKLGELLDGAGGAVSGLGWVILLALLVAAVVVVIALKTGRMQRQVRAPSAPVFGQALLSAADHRARADAASREGRWTAAVLESFRALVRRLEERGTLEHRPGRTADETVREAGGYLPQLAAELNRAAQTFDAVLYGDKPGSPQLYAQITQVDDAAATARPVVGL